MKHVKNKPHEMCEDLTGPIYQDEKCTVMISCGKPAKYERLPPELCEHPGWRWGITKLGYDIFAWLSCGSKAKYECLFEYPKAKPMRLCGIHARQAKRRGFIVKPIGE